MLIFGKKALFPIAHTSKLFERQLKSTIQESSYRKNLYPFTLNICSLFYFDDDFSPEVSGPKFSDGFHSIILRGNPDLYCLYKMNKIQQKVYFPCLCEEHEIGTINRNNILYYPCYRLFGDYDATEKKLGGEFGI